MGLNIRSYLGLMLIGQQLWNILAYKKPNYLYYYYNELKTMKKLIITIIVLLFIATSCCNDALIGNKYRVIKCRELSDPLYGKKYKIRLRSIETSSCMCTNMYTCTPFNVGDTLKIGYPHKSKSNVDSKR